ncbi:MAG TPA: Rv3235 family protein [Pseudonocardiaceae bacterium]
MVDDPAPTPLVPPPPSAAEVRGLLTCVLEVLDGRRPLNQFDKILPRHCYKPLAEQAGGTGPRQLRSLHLSQTTPAVVDFCARIDQGRRSRALTGRLILIDDRWRFTLLAVV